MGISNLDLRPAAFLDRDGILNFLHQGRPPWKPNELKIYRLSSAIVSLLKTRYIPVVVTNQPDSARGDVPRQSLDLIANLVCTHFHIDHYYACYHGFDGDCLCRKPLPGMLFKAACDLSLDLTKSLLIGDRAKDIIAGKSAGVQTILCNYNPSELDKLHHDPPSYAFQTHLDLLEYLQSTLL